jgi:hypothetical protein
VGGVVGVYDFGVEFSRSILKKTILEKRKKF